MPPDRRHFLTLALGAAIGLAGAPAAWAADKYPSKPVSIMVPYPAGGISDTIARRVHVPLGKALGQPVIVENLGGASGTIGAQKVLRSPADGYTIFQGSPNELILAPLAIPGIKYQPEYFRQVHRISRGVMAILARADLPAGNADELAAYAARVAKEGQPMTYASVGNGSFYHLMGAKMSAVLGVPMTHVPYKGAADATRDLMGKLVDVFITPISTPQIEMIKQGKIKAVAVLTPQRQPALPGVPTTGESKALANYQYEIGTGYFVRRDTPEPVVEVLHRALQQVLGDPELKATLEASGAEVSPPQTLAEADAAYRKEIATYQAIAKSIGLDQQ